MRSRSVKAQWSSSSEAPPLILRLLVAVLGLGSVLSLLAWVYEIAGFQQFFVAVSLPMTLALVAVGIVVSRRNITWWRQAMAAGAFAGLLGTFGYDIFRLPFVALGFQVLAPIDSYGVLLLDESTSTAWTGLTGWSYHFLNGIGFGVAYGVVAKGRHWGWGVLWALILETATIITPFADSYALRGKWVPISIAYAAHIPYGLALGLVVQRADRFTKSAVETFRYPIVLSLVAVFAGLAVWLRPWSTDPSVREGREFAKGASAVIERAAFVPLWMRVGDDGECATVRNDSDRTYGFASGSNEVVGNGDEAELCFADSGVHRVRLTLDGKERGHSGGFLIVDPKH